MCKKNLHGCGRNEKKMVSSGKLVCVFLFTIGVFLFYLFSLQGKFIVIIFLMFITLIGHLFYSGLGFIFLDHVLFYYM